MIDSQTFGQLALQLLQQASIPGAALDAAVEFRAVAKALAEGAAAITPAEASEKPE